jgi:membrane-bound metal-dependent hydrolase YbcI (DUF457 family)
MPSPIGHALAGLAIGLAGSDPRSARQARWRMLPTIAMAAAVVAMLPDADLIVSLFRPSVHRMASHSIGATFLIFIVAAGVTRQVTGRIGWRVALLMAAAHASHILLDWMAMDVPIPDGIQALWPFSDRRYLSGWDLFPPTERRIFGNPQALPMNLRALVTELLVLGPCALLALAVTRKRRTRGLTSAPDSPRRPSASATGTGGTSDRRTPGSAR